MGKNYLLVIYYFEQNRLRVNSSINITIDKRKEFINENLKKLCNKYETNCINGRPKHLESLGQVEC